eukprot:6343497-Amphidinium_carterae.1
MDFPDTYGRVIVWSVIGFGGEKHSSILCRVASLVPAYLFVDQSVHGPRSNHYASYFFGFAYRCDSVFLAALLALHKGELVPPTSNHVWIVAIRVPPVGHRPAER